MTGESRPAALSAFDSPFFQNLAYALISVSGSLSDNELHNAATVVLSTSMVSVGCVQPAVTFLSENQCAPLSHSSLDAFRRRMLDVMFVVGSKKNVEVLTERRVWEYKSEMTGV